MSYTGNSEIDTYLQEIFDSDEFRAIPRKFNIESNEYYKYIDRYVERLEENINIKFGSDECYCGLVDIIYELHKI